jgi:serine/threonine-protein kinase
VIHRDLKPENIVLRHHKYPVLVDLGIAHVMGSEDRFVRHGTWGYMSPEQAAGRLVDARSDLYSVGAIVYELLTGQLPVPFLSQSTSETKLRTLEKAKITPIEARCPELDPAFCALVNSLLDRSPHKRPADARELAERVRALSG